MNENGPSWFRQIVQPLFDKSTKRNKGEAEEN